MHKRPWKYEEGLKKRRKKKMTERGGKNRREKVDKEE